MKIINRLLVDDDGRAMYCGFSCMQCGLNCVHLEVKGNEIITHCTKRSFLISAGKPEVLMGPNLVQDLVGELRKAREALRKMREQFGFLVDLYNHGNEVKGDANYWRSFLLYQLNGICGILNADMSRVKRDVVTPAADSKRESPAVDSAKISPVTGWSSTPGKDSEGQPCRVFGPAEDTETHD